MNQELHAVVLTLPALMRATMRGDDMWSKESVGAATTACNDAILGDGLYIIGTISEHNDAWREKEGAKSESGRLSRAA